MAGYVELDEVRPWYDELSSGSSGDPEHDFLATDPVLTLAPVRRAARMPSQGETR